MIERIWGTIGAMARCLMKKANTPEVFWSFAYRAAFHIKNRCIHSAHGKTPFEKFFGELPKVSHLKVFGCRAYMYVEKSKRRKFDSRAREGILLGYSNNSNSYLIGFFEDGELVTKQSRNVHFCENKFLNESTSQKTDISESEDNELIFELNERGSCEDISEETDIEVPSQNKAKVAPAVFSEPIQSRKSRYGRVIKPPNRYTPGNSGNLCFDSFSSEFENREDLTSNYVDQELPKNLEETLSSPKWYYESRV